MRLLGENLIAFRTTSGAVGLMQNACPHRGASMFFGRNEEEGLRCVYHGWKFDVDRRLRRHAVRAGRVQLQEQGAYARLPVRRARRRHLGLHGPADGRRRRCPSSRPTCSRRRRLGADQAAARACNWMQALEGDIDTVPRRLPAPRLREAGRHREPGSFDYYGVKDRTPRYDVIDTDVRHDLRRLPSGRGGQLLLAHRPRSSCRSTR